LFRNRLVVGAVGRVDRHHHQDAGVDLLHRDALRDHFLGQARLGLRHAVLGEGVGGVQIGADLEGHVELHAAVAGVQRLHVEHVVHAVDLLLDGRGHRLLDHLGAGARVGGGDLDVGRGELRILLDGQLEQGGDPDQHDQDRDHHGHDGPADEELAMAYSAAGARRAACGLQGGGDRRVVLQLLDALHHHLFAGLRPSVITIRLPTRGPGVTLRNSAVRSARTTKTEWMACSSFTARCGTRIGARQHLHRHAHAPELAGADQAFGVGEGHLEQQRAGGGVHVAVGEDHASPCAGAAAPSASTSSKMLEALGAGLLVVGPLRRQVQVVLFAHAVAEVDGVDAGHGGEQRALAAPDQVAGADLGLAHQPVDGGVDLRVAELDLGGFQRGLGGVHPGPGRALGGERVVQHLARDGVLLPQRLQAADIARGLVELDSAWARAPLLRSRLASSERAR
jgi:hypothetical protein